MSESKTLSFTAAGDLNLICVGLSGSAAQYHERSSRGLCCWRL